jgi:hypothetical protein
MKSKKQILEKIAECEQAIKGIVETESPEHIEKVGFIAALKWVQGRK